MIPLLEDHVRSQEKMNQTTPLSFIKLHNGLAYSNPKVSFVVFRDREPILFLKSVRNVFDNPIIEHAYRCLERAHADRERFRFSLEVPVPRWCAPVRDCSVSAESILAGRPLRIEKQQEQDRILSILLDWQKEAWKHAPRFVPIQEIYSRFRDGIGCSAEMTARLDRTFHESTSATAGTPSSLPVVSAHGDFTPSNVLMLDGGNVGAVDWDRYGDIDTPLFDILTLTERMAPKGQNPLKVYQAEIRKHLAMLGLSDASFPVVFFLYVLGTEWRKRRHTHAYEREAVERDFKQNLDLALESLRAWS